MSNKLKTSEVHDILAAMYPLRRELVPCLLGAPGIGKTQGIYRFAEELGVKVVTFILSNTLPSEVSGIHMPDKGEMVVFDNQRLLSLEDGDILFFDEVFEASPQLWASCLTLIQDRIMASGRKLPDVFIVAASNPPASPTIIPPSVRDRFQILDLDFDFDTWAAWFKRTRKVRPPEVMKNYIQSTSNDWNILTPRRFTKLFDWLKLEGDRRLKERVITQMFDGVIAQHLMNMLDQVPDERDQIAMAIDGLAELPQSWDTMPLGDILEYLMKLDNWADIAEALSNTEMQEKKEAF